MKEKVYIETSVVSYLTARPSRDIIITAHQQITYDWWENQRINYELYTSQVVIREAGVGDPIAAEKRLTILNNLKLLNVSDEAIIIVEELIKKNCLPEKAVEDALHIAVTTVHSLNYLLTWNCKHIANATKRNLIEEIIKSFNYKPPIICTPEELLGD